jgi:hypothetical protein
MQTKINCFRTLLLFSLLGFLLPVYNLCYAQNDKHFLTVWADVGYSSFFTKWDEFKNAGYVGSGVGLGYSAIIREHFILSTGVEYISLNSSTQPKDFVFYRDLIDSENDEYVMKYTLQRFVQLDRTHNIFVPVYFGFKTDLRKINFFMQAGGKVGYMFASKCSSKISSYTTIGIYDRFIDPFKEMPNHYFTTKKYNSTEELNFNKLQAVVSIELGLDFPSFISKNGMRISIFADYGITNRQNSEAQQLYKELFVFEKIPNNIHVNNLYETNSKISSKTSTFFAGVKITVLFDVTKPPCPSCLPVKVKRY